ncbi:kinase subdomain-containing protein [Xylariaceae sp. FL0016]|nr:kinase subdomain-containing protein [Xylariaceae sp. FL0016]
MERPRTSTRSTAPPRILSLDGGGIRGKSSLLILERIMETIRAKDIIAIMLGRLGMTVDECIRAYDKAVRMAFTPRRRILPSIASPKGAFSAQSLEEAIVEVVREFCTDPACVELREHGRSTTRTCPHRNLAFRHAACTKTDVLAITKQNTDAMPTLFRTYDRYADFQDCTIWEIARATSAATTFFKSIELGRDRIEFIDAGFGHNNPCETLIDEARRQFPERGQPIVLSIGTGLRGVVTIKDTRSSILSALKNMASTSEKVAARLDTRYGDSRQYYRFNVDRGLDDITLSDWEKTSSISGHTINYLRANERKIESFARDLISPDNLEEYLIPLPENRHFTGRQHVVEDIKDGLFIQKSTPKLALDGLGGVGKTQIALHVAYSVKLAQPDCSVFWVPAVSMATFEQAYADIARLLNIHMKATDDLKASVRRHLESNRAGKWFLIVDNADDPTLMFGGERHPEHLSRYLPSRGNGSIMLTTRSREVATSVANSDVITLDEMSPEEAEQPHQDKTMNAALLRELTYLPLAIVQAAAYLNQNRMPVSKYLKLLCGTEENMTRLLRREFKDNNRYHGSRNAVATTWLVSFDQIRKSDTAAANLLSFMGFIEPKAISQSILPKLSSEEELERSIGVLCGYAFLVRRGDDDVFDMHRLVHVAIRVWLQQNGDIDQAESDAVRHLISTFPEYSMTDRLYFGNLGLVRKIIPHAFRALEITRNHQGRERSELCSRTCCCLVQERRFQEAVTLLEETYAWTEEQLSPDDACQLRIKLAVAYAGNGKAKQGIQMVEHVVTLHKASDERDVLRQSSETLLAYLYLFDNRTKEAIEILEQHKTLSQKDCGRLASEQELGWAYLKDDRLKEAIQTMEHEAIGILEHVSAVHSRMLDEGDPDGVVTQDCLVEARQMLAESRR